MVKKIKNNDKDTLSRSDITNSKPTHIKFNFSFITANNEFCFENGEFNDAHKLKLLERILTLSQETLVTVLNYKKNIGIEFIPKEQCREVGYNPRFTDAEHRKKEVDGKYAVFRIYQNNNPLPSRAIGKLINNVFYILFIDLNHKMYKSS
ncbi:hypothetical protein NSQ20_11480 [Paenibacillus sp. FSL K6-1122]|uniref:hypothetical protein n=1 Tax=Paenibacillus sp. FSL K6-1122 TaxID=2954512 RepID=UPI0030EDDA13